MANSSSPCLRFLAAMICLIIGAATIAAVEGSKDYDLGFPAGNGGCRGSIAECSIENDVGLEMESESESNRRILATTQYISYGALQSNTVPCSQRGASYYNCKPGAQANPYSRGCSQIARCRS